MLKTLNSKQAMFKKIPFVKSDELGNICFAPEKSERTRLLPSLQVKFLVRIKIKYRKEKVGCRRGAEVKYRIL